MIRVSALLRILLTNSAKEYMGKHDEISCKPCPPGNVPNANHLNHALLATRTLLNVSCRTFVVRLMCRCFSLLKFQGELMLVSISVPNSQMRRRKHTSIKPRAVSNRAWRRHWNLEGLRGIGPFLHVVVVLLGRGRSGTPFDREKRGCGWI